MNARVVLALLAMVVCTPPVGAQSAPWREATPGFSWSFPGDHWSHPGYRTEWWYLTGQLRAPDGGEFGYQFTVFRVGLAAQPPALRSSWSAADLVMGHLAITDLTTGEHRFAEVLWRANGALGAFPGPSDTLLAWARAPAGQQGRWTLAWRDGGFSVSARDGAVGIGIDLHLTPTVPLTLQGPGGFSRKSERPGAASLYYSFTRLASAGTVHWGTRTMSVSGESWMDKEFGSNQLAPEQVGWDWFALRLDDGRDLMVYLLRDSTGATDHARATLSRAGQARHLEADELRVTPQGRWVSPRTGTAYPAGWRIEVPGESLVLDLVPDAEAQENVSLLVPGLFYWEGSVTVVSPTRQRVGRGYVELTGYGSGIRPAI